MLEDTLLLIRREGEREENGVLSHTQCNMKGVCVRVCVWPCACACAYLNTNDFDKEHWTSLVLRSAHPQVFTRGNSLIESKEADVVQLHQALLVYEVVRKEVGVVDMRSTAAGNEQHGPAEASTAL